MTSYPEPKFKHGLTMHYNPALKLCSGPVAKKEEQNQLFNMERLGGNLLC